MPANHTSSTRARRARRAFGVLAVAASLVTGAGAVTAAVPGASSGVAAHSAADGAGVASTTNDLTQFAVDSPAMIQAELIAVKYWGTSPCGGTVSVSWAALDPSINGSSNWWNPVSAYGNAGQNTQCRITLNQNQAFDWRMFCTVMVHEIGHLVGQQHTTDETSVMYPIYIAPITECTGQPDGSPAAAPVAPQAKAAAASAGTTHRAHSTHKAHKKAKKKAKKAHA
jgi:hypothetical protein